MGSRLRGIGDGGPVRSSGDGDGPFLLEASPAVWHRLILSGDGMLRAIATDCRHSPARCRCPATAHNAVP